MRVELPEEPDVIALPQTVVSTTLYGDSVFVVRTEGEGDAAKKTVEQVFVNAGRRSLGLVEITERRRRRRRGGHRRAEPADQRRARSSSTTRSTRRPRAPGGGRAARGELGAAPGALRALHPPARCSPTVLAAFILLLGIQGIVNLPIREYPEVEETVVTITTIYAGAQPDLIQGFITAPIAARRRHDREHRLRHLASPRRRQAWSACT